MRALTWNPQGRRKRVKTRNTWRRDTEAEMQRSGRSWRELEKTAQSRVRWRIVVDVLMLLMGLSKQVSKLVIFSSLLPKHDN